MIGAGKVRWTAGIPVAAKELFMFLRENQALSSTHPNQPLLQRIINALTVTTDVSISNSLSLIYAMFLFSVHVLIC